MKMRRQSRQDQQHKGREVHKYQQYHQQQMQKQVQCNKGKATKFKRSCSNLEEDGASLAFSCPLALPALPRIDRALEIRMYINRGLDSCLSPYK
ncbi:hypothetical protein Tsubulata_021842 [Turnera subulata]|uniref:Uncharacterized protein n=1 Tax=Turnera subulata TaxID=218843 RepID=A0A9Q0JKD2_9ROSI|nr:hypothetical protein Tsubulata_021842 [Turnera subulata]